MYKFRPITICRYAQKTSWIRKDYVETQTLIWKKEKKKKSGKNSLIWWNRKKYHDNLHKRKYNNNTAKAFRELFSSLYYWVPKISVGFWPFQLGRQKIRLYLVHAQKTQQKNNSTTSAAPRIELSLTLLGVVLIKITTVSAKFNNTRLSLIINK